MDFLEKLDLLMAKNHLNKSTLSKACDIPYTTIDGWYKKGYEGLKLTTLRKLAAYFGTSLDYWASEGEDRSKGVQNLSELHRQAVSRLEEMPEEEVKAVLAFIRSLDEIKASFSAGPEPESPRAQRRK